ncbi:hypothetical protein ACS0TY_011280 [Phlomoides rotata]
MGGGRIPAAGKVMLKEFWVGNEELVSIYDKRLGDAGYINFKLARTNNRGDDGIFGFSVLSERRLLQAKKRRTKMPYMLPMKRQNILDSFFPSSCTLNFSLENKRLRSTNKRLSTFALLTPLTSVIISTLCVYLSDHTCNSTSKPLDQIHFSGSYVTIGFRIGAIAGMVALTEAVAIGRTFAAMKDYHLDGNKEMVALGTMILTNVVQDEILRGQILSVEYTWDP